MKNKIANSYGFTMLEILVALVILGLVSAALTLSLRTALDAGARARREADRLQEVRIVFSAIERDLRAAYFVPQSQNSSDASSAPSVPGRQTPPENQNPPENPIPPDGSSNPAETPDEQGGQKPPDTWFVGEKASSSSGSTRLSLTALSHRLSGLRPFIAQEGAERLSEPQSDLCAVEYAVGIEESTGMRGLLRRERVPPQAVAPRGVREELISDRVVDLNFRYDDGQEWQERWSTDQGSPELPRRVEITVVFRHPEEEAAEVYTTTVSLTGEADPWEMPSEPVPSNAPPSTNEPASGNTPPGGNNPPSGNVPAPGPS